MNESYFSAGKILILVLLSFFSVVSFGIDFEKEKINNMSEVQEGNNRIVKSINDYFKQKSKETPRNKEINTLFGKILFSIIAIILFAISIFVPFLLLFIAIRNNDELKETLSYFSLFKVFFKS